MTFAERLLRQANSNDLSRRDLGRTTLRQANSNDLSWRDGSPPQLSPPVAVSAAALAVPVVAAAAAAVAVPASAAAVAVPAAALAAAAVNLPPFFQYTYLWQG